MKVVDLITSIQTADGDLSLDIIIGEGQIGASAVRLDGKIIATGENVTCALGSTADLPGRVLITKSTVADVNDHTNKTSVTYVFRNGESTQRLISRAEVDRQGDAVLYRSHFTFV